MKKVFYLGTYLMKWELIRGQERFRASIFEACKATKHGFQLDIFKTDQILPRFFRRNPNFCSNEALANLSLAISQSKPTQKARFQETDEKQENNKHI